MIPSLDRGPIHLIGIAGTAMASLAGLLRERGLEVTGSDQSIYPPMSDVLAELGIDVRTPYAPANVPEDATLVVVGNALSRGNPELEYVLERRLPYVSMPDVLEELFLRERLPVVVAGTHGKTTTTSLTAWLLSSAGMDPGFLVGGIPLNFGRSYRVGSGEPFVIEGDEYDTAYFDKGPKFLHYLPHVAVLGNVEFDHADIYRDLDHVATAFRLLVNLVPRNGLLVAGVDSPLARRIAEESAQSPVTTFSTEPGMSAEWTGSYSGSDGGSSRFRIERRGATFVEGVGPYWGDAALRNVLAAAAVADYFGASPDAIAGGLAEFQGVKRRLEVRGEVSGVTVVDDFAHHPTAIAATIAGARRRWPGARVWGVFEPRSYTVRSRVFEAELTEALAGADRVVLAAVFRSQRLAAEDELSEEQVVSELVSRGVPASFVPGPGAADSIAELVSKAAEPGDVVLVMSNGAFGGVHEKLLTRLSRGSGSGSSD